MPLKDHYQILGVGQSASPDQIKRAYRKLARKFHPDVSKEPDATLRFTEINEANAVLSDSQKRAAYDALQQEKLRRGQREFRSAPGVDPRAAYAHRAHHGRDTHEDTHEDTHDEYGEFFESLFGRGARARQGPSRGPDIDGAGVFMRGGDLHAKIELDLLDAYHGAERTITLQAASPGEIAAGQAMARHLQIQVPKGVRAGQRIRIAGQGGVGLGGEPAGDLLLEVCFRVDSRWRSEGADVYQRLPLSPWEAMLGGTIHVDTPGGGAQVKVPPGWKSGRQLRLKGRGIPGPPAGDLYLELEIGLPPADSEPGRAAYKALASAFPDYEPRRAQGA